MAANAYDARKHPAAQGTDYNSLLVHRKEAATQCERAVTQFPNELRFQYQLARAIELDDPKRAAAMYSNLIMARYLAAYDNLGWMYNTGRYGGRVNKIVANKLFREGAELGDPDSMHSLGVALWDENPRQAAEWFQRAVKLGHLEAKKNLEKLEAESKRVEQPEVFPLFRFFKQK
jgi:TPR repeat protein